MDVPTGVAADGAKEISAADDIIPFLLSGVSKNEPLLIVFFVIFRTFALSSLLLG